MKRFSQFLTEGRYFSHDKPHKLGSELTPDQQRQVKYMFVHRHTGSHTPAHEHGTGRKPLYKDDAEWLAHTHFNVKKDGKLANAGCHSMIPKRHSEPKADRNGQMNMFGEDQMIAELKRETLASYRSKAYADSHSGIQPAGTTKARLKTIEKRKRGEAGAFNRLNGRMMDKSKGLRNDKTYPTKKYNCK